MKKLISLSLIAICFAQMAQAQIKKGSKSVGGTVGGAASTNFYDNGQKKNKSSSISTNVAAGKAVKENSVIGIIIGYAHNSFKELDGSAAAHGNNYSAGMFWTGYRKLAKDVYFFTSLSASGSYGDQHSNSSLGINFSHSKTCGAGASVTPGVSYRLYRRLYVEASVPSIASVQYNTIKITGSSGESRQNSFGAATSLTNNPLNSLGVGLRCIL